MNLLHIPDINGNNSSKSLAQYFLQAGIALPAGNLVKWVRIAEVSGGTTGSRVGNSMVSATNGVPFNSNDAMFLPPAQGYAADALMISAKFICGRQPAM